MSACTGPIAGRKNALGEKLIIFDQVSRLPASDGPGPRPNPKTKRRKHHAIQI